MILHKHTEEVVEIPTAAVTRDENALYASKAAAFDGESLHEEEEEGENSRLHPSSRALGVGKWLLENLF